MSEQTGTFYAVSVGPGDPELLTLQAVRVLENTPVIAAPQTASGQMLALDIARGAVDLTGKSVLPLRFTMSHDAAVRAESYRAAASAVEAELRQGAAEQDKYLTGRFSPGYGDWPIGVQPLVAAALDTARRAGLCVTENDLMTPRKSVTALLGLSDHPVKGRLAGCGHCVLNTRCEYRKRGKTCASE